MKTLLKRLLPNTISNECDGWRIVFYGFILLSVLSVFRSLTYIFISDLEPFIPLDGFFVFAILDNIGITNIIINLLNLWGVAQLLLGIIYLVAIFFYKSLIPLLLLLMGVENITRYFLFNPMLMREEANSSIESLSTQIFLVVIPILLFISFIPKTKNELNKKRLIG